MSDGLNVCFRGVAPDEGVVALARRMFHEAAGATLRGKSCSVWLTRAPDGVTVHANVTLAWKTRVLGCSGSAEAPDAYRAMVAAFAAAEAAAQPRSACA